MKQKKIIQVNKKAFIELSTDDMKNIVGSGNSSIHTIPPEIFEAMFLQPTKMK